MYESQNTEVPEGVLDLTLPEIPPRSRLHSLEPMGLGTSQVESLTSYLIRLAESHCVTVTSLYQYELYPLVKKLRSSGEQAGSRQNGHCLMNDMKLTNGGGSWAKTWVQAVEYSTLRSDLSLLTTLPWGSDLAWFCKLRESPAWCPDCYDDWWETGRVIYTPLIWMLRVVNVCTAHRRFLEDLCPHCRRRPHICFFRSRSGCCSRCNNWLGSNRTNRVSATSINPQELSQQTWISTTVSEWVASAQGLKIPPGKETVTRTIAELIRRVTGGNCNRFARMVGVLPGTLYGWWRRIRGVPQLELLLKICSNFEISLTELLTGSCVLDGSASASHTRTRLRQLSPLAPHYKKVEVIAFLKAALKEDPPPSLRDLAARLGYKSESSLRQASPELSRNIVARHRAVRTNKRRVKFIERDSQAIRSVLEAALEQECPPSLEKLRLAVECERRTLLKRFPDLCRRVVVKREDFRRKSILGMQKELKEALEETPPLSLREVARRLGANDINLLYRCFPSICPSVVARHNAWKQSCFDQVRVKLQAALEEIPPRPMKELARELNFEVSTLRRRYKELCRQISARYIAYARGEAEEMRRQVREEVREAAITLIERGLHPTDQRVRPLLKKWQNRYFAERSATLRSIRREFGLRDGRHPSGQAFVSLELLKRV